MNYEKLAFEDKSLDGESCCANEDEVRHNNIPNADQWYHGQLNREKAEDRLVRKNLLGSFLVRKSNDETSSFFVLSYLSNESKITHYRINIISHTWLEIGGNSFRDLKCLISHYHETEIIPNQKLRHSVRPPLRPLETEEETRKVARMPYCKRPDTNELSFKAGDLFVLEKVCDDGWLWVSVMATRRWGFAHDSLLEDASLYPEAVERLPFFHFGSIEQDEVKSILTNAGQYSYLLRPSERASEYYRLLFYDGAKIHKFRICIVSHNNDQCVFQFGKNHYLSIEELITDYEKRYILEANQCMLRNPVPRRREHTCSSPDDDIYEAVRMTSHTPAQIPTLEVALHGELYIWLKKKKKWKLYYGVLDKKNKSLMLYEKHQVKDVITLEKRKFLPVHPSLHGKKLCFQLASDGLTSADAIYTIISVEQSPPFLQAVEELSAAFKKKLQSETYAGILNFEQEDALCTPEQSAQRWICEIRRMCKKATPVFALEDKEKKERESRIYRELLVTINQASSLKHPPVYCTICIEDIAVAKTQLLESSKEPGNYNFNETFVFEDLASDFKTVSIQIESQKKRLGTVTKQFSDIQTIEGVEKNECLNSSSNASIYLKLRYKKLTVLPFKRYLPLKHALIDNMNSTIVQLNEFSFTDVQQLARCLFNVALFYNKHIEMIVLLFTKEIQQNDSASLFRKNTLASFLLDEYTKRIAGQWRDVCLRQVVDSVRQIGDIALEVDECKLDPTVPKEQLVKNQETLKTLLELAITSIFRSTSSCPLPLRDIYSQLQDCVMTRALKEDVPSAHTRLICNLVFLRVLCPPLSTSGTWPCSTNINNSAGIPSDMALSGIAFPNHELTLDRQATVPETSKRTLTMIAKGLIALPAENAPKADVKFYGSVLEKYKPLLQEFIKELTQSLGEEEMTKLKQIRAQEQEELCRYVSRSRDLADIHAMLSRQLDRIKDTQSGRMNPDLIAAIEIIK